MNVYNVPLSISSSAYCLNGTAVLSLTADDRNRHERTNACALVTNIQASSRARKNNIFSMKFIETYVGFGDCAEVNKI